MNGHRGNFVNLARNLGKKGRYGDGRGNIGPDGLINGAPTPLGI
jgi:hypothetical protein